MRYLSFTRGVYLACAVWMLCCLGVVHAQTPMLDMPTRIVVDTQGNVFVIEQLAMRIAKFNSAGTLLTRFGANGTAPGQFSSVQDIALDPSGNVLVLDRNAKAVHRFTNAGVYLDTRQLFPANFQRRLHSLVVDAAGRLFVSDDNGSGSIAVFDAAGQFVTSMAFPVVPGATGADTPGDLAIDASGNLYVADRANNRILKFGTTGPANDPFVWLGWIGGCTSGPRCQAVPGSGPPSRTTSWCTDASQCGEPRSAPAHIPVPPPATDINTSKGRFIAPIFVSVAANGTLNVSDIGSGFIQRFDANGAYLGDLAPRGRAPGETGGDATAVGPNGDIYATQTRLGRVSRFAAGGGFTAVFGGGVELSVMPGDTALNPLKYTVPGLQQSTIGVISIGGYAGPLSLASTQCYAPSGQLRSCASLGITTAFSNASLTVGPGTAAVTVLQVTTSPSTPDGLILVVVESATPGVSAFAQVLLDVKLDRRLSVLPTPNAITLMPGDPAKDVDIAVKSINVTGNVTLNSAFAVLTPASQLSFDTVPNSSFPITPNATVSRTLRVTAKPLARTGNHTLNVTASASSIVKATSPIDVKVECNCSKTGNFVLPSVRPVTPTSGLSGTSPDGHFIVTAASTSPSASVSVAAQSAPSVALVNTVSNVSSWGFSPDSRYFIVTKAGPSSHLTELEIYDLNFQNRRILSEVITSCPLGMPTCVPPPSFCYGGGGQPANNACLGSSGATQMSNFQVGNAAWGFGPDSKSFVLVSANPLVSSTQYNLALYNLTTGSQATRIVSTTGQTISTFWQFSPCGDLFMHFEQQFATPSSNDVARFFKTNSTTQRPAFEEAHLIIAANGTVASGPVGAQVEPAFFSNADFDVRLLNLAHTTGAPSNGFVSPQCQRR